MAKPGLHQEAIVLRRDSRWSIPEIQTKLGVSKSILSLWLRDYPLTEEERRVRRQGLSPPRQPIKERGVESDLFRLAASLPIEQGTNWKGRVAEAAVLLRLVVRGLNPLRCTFEGDAADWTVYASSRAIRLQVRWATVQGKRGLPLFSIRKSNRKPYKGGDVDFFVGYCLFNDTAYVYSVDEVKNDYTISVRPDAAERWDKLQV